jgi:hypothetical protein
MYILFLSRAKQIKASSLLIIFLFAPFSLHFKPLYCMPIFPHFCHSYSHFPHRPQGSISPNFFAKRKDGVCKKNSMFDFTNKVNGRNYRSKFAESVPHLPNAVRQKRYRILRVKILQIFLVKSTPGT